MPTSPTMASPTTQPPPPPPPPFDPQQQQQQQLPQYQQHLPQHQQQPPQLLLAQLTTVKNARDLASAAPRLLLAPGMLFRSACPAGCSERDASLLCGGLGVRTLLDLRSDEERLQDPRCLLLHARGSEVRAFDRAGVGAAPSSSSSSAAAAAGENFAPSSSRSSLSNLARRLLGRESPRKPIHRPTLPLGHVPADDPAPPNPGEPSLVVRHVSLLDKKRFRKALIAEMPKRSAAAVMALGLLARVTPSALGFAEKSRELAMDKINEGGLSNMYHCLLESSDAEIAAALRLLLSSAERGAPALFFCRAGKDRTGLVSALLLSVCGADDDSILNDYVLSDDPRAQEIALGGLEKSRDLQGLDTRAFARAPREALAEALRRLRAKHGSVGRYLDERAGFTLAEQARLRAALAGKRPTPAL